MIIAVKIQVTIPHITILTTQTALTDRKDIICKFSPPSQIVSEQYHETCGEIKDHFLHMNHRGLTE